MTLCSWQDFELQLLTNPSSCREEDGRKRVKELQKQIQDVKVEKELELQQRNEMISHLKDQLQEMKAKSNMEGKYIKKCAEVAVAQTQKRCMLSEKELKDEIEVRLLSLLSKSCTVQIFKKHSAMKCGKAAITQTQHQGCHYLDPEKLHAL